jgi:hypothetical protein
MISRQSRSTRNGIDGVSLLENSHLKVVVPEVNSRFLARLREIHRINSYSVPG